LKEIELLEVIITGKDMRKPPQLISLPIPNTNLQVQIRTPQNNETPTVQ